MLWKVSKDIFSEETESSIYWKKNWIIDIDNWQLPFHPVCNVKEGFKDQMHNFKYFVKELFSSGK